MARKAGRLRSLISLATWAVTAAALLQELRKPDNERTWQGEVAGFVPYDFRIPTMARVRERLWNPDDERIVMPGVFGVGWTINVGRVARVWRGGS